MIEQLAWMGLPKRSGEIEMGSAPKMGHEGILTLGVWTEVCGPSKDIGEGPGEVQEASLLFSGE